MYQKQSLGLIIGTALTFTMYELVGHWLLMAVPMAVRHGMSILIGTTLALLIAAVSIHAIWRQQGELRELARLRDYLLLMQSHYLRQSPSARSDPRQQLEFQALELQYAEIQQRLAADSPTARARALLDLSELALTHLASMEAPYPFFPHAASHLAAALYLEVESVARDEALHSLQRLADFARDNEPDLLPLLIDNLAHANRAAYTTLVDALALHAAITDSAEVVDLNSLLPLIRFTTSAETDAKVLHELADSPACRKSMMDQRISRIAGDKPSPDEAHAVQAASYAASALRDTRDTLALALRALPAPADYPSASEDHHYWKRAHPILLRDAFLVGAELTRAQMQGVDLQRASLQAATLSDAQLQNTDLSGANLWKAQLIAAGLENARLWGADLRDASLTAARLEGADLSRACLQGAHLTGAHLKDACLWQITIADDEDKLEHRSVFLDANWWAARFTDRLTGSTDRKAQTWLKYAYPRPAPEADTIVKVPVSPFTHA